MDKPNIKGVLILLVVVAFMLQFGYVKAEEVSKKCNSNKSEVRKMEKDFTKVIFNTWRKAGNKSDPQQLWREAEFTAYWILRDNRIVCR